MTVLWQEKRFACQKCLKGHRVNTCTHIKRSLNEIKSAGRPVSQCNSCRAKRLAGQGHIHHKCKCGSSPPKLFREYYKLSFLDGLELIFYSASNINIVALQEQVQQNTPMEIKIQRGKDDPDTVMLAPQSFAILKEDVPKEEVSENNPCRCHFGGECICSLLPQKKKKSSYKSHVSNNSFNQKIENDSEESKCSCSSGCGCSSSPSGCQCNQSSNNNNQDSTCCSSSKPFESDSDNKQSSTCCSTSKPSVYSDSSTKKSCFS